MILLLAAIGALGVAAIGSCLSFRRDRLARALVVAALAAAGAAGGLLAWRVLAGRPVPDLIWPWLLPGAVFHIGIDALSACFLLLVILVCVCAGVYGEGYLSASRGHVPALPARFFFLVLTGSMMLLVCSRNALLFMAAWETMALAAFGLVSSEHDKAEVRKAGLLYLVCTHVGTLLLLCLFALLGRHAGSLEFSAFAAAPPFSPAARAGIVLLALTGFGLKAGLLPLHIWLQEAHPAAPSHASAAMSGALIEMGLYGLLRLFSLIGPVTTTFASALVGLGLATAVFGIMFALVQRDFKRLLAYSSIENVGIILAALGLGCYGAASGSAALAVLGFAGAILHTLNHGIFKPLLFLSAGAIYQAVGTRDIEACGGLQKRMPWTCGFTAVGAAAICGLPPFNGFVGEWLIYAWLLRPGPGRDIRLTAPSAAVLALAGALAVIALTKFYGLVCLGQPRSQGARDAVDPSPIMLAPMAVLAALCVGVGLFPGAALSAAVAAAADVARVAPSAVADHFEEWSRLLGVVGLLGGGVWIVSGVLYLFRASLLRGRTVSSGPTWSCGFTAPTARMQYSGSSYPQPAARVLAGLLNSEEQVQPPSGYWPARASFSSRTPDPVLDRWLPALTARFDGWLAAPRRLQHGRLQVYLFYVSAFLVAVLLWKL
ncbi:MAG: proton-conducting transporter membrane subunit [Elusimicrobiota bacterium]